VPVAGCEDASNHENDQNRQKPEELFAPSPQWINQQRSDQKQLEVDCQVPGNVIALKGEENLMVLNCLLSSVDSAHDFIGIHVD
jgi:hypothetical protein